MFLPPTHEQFPWTGVFTGFLTVGLWYTCASQHIVQRVLSAKNEWHARMGVVSAGFLRILTPLFFVVPGIAAYKLLPELEAARRQDHAYLLLVQTLIPTGLKGLVLAGMAAALMSTVSTVLNSTSTLLTIDVYKKLFRPAASDREQVVSGMISGVVALVISVFIAFLYIESPEALFRLVQRIFFWIAPPFAVVFLLGLLWRQVTAAHFINAYFAPLLVGEAVATGGSPVRPLADEPAAATPVGESIDDIERLSAKFRSAVAGNFFTKAAVEMALWDIVGKAHGRPVHELLGQRRRDLVPTKWSVSRVEPAKAAEIANWATSQGFSAMKVKVGIDPDGDLARVHAVREAVGPTVKLGIDANGGWPTAGIAIDTIKRLCDQCAIYFAEQPVPAGDHNALSEVRRNVPVPIIADESVYTLEDAKMLARAEAADVFSIYVGKAGGIAPAREIARFAQSVGIACTIGSNLELGVGSAAMIHLALSASGIDADTYPCDIIGPMFYEDDVLAEPLPISGGSAKVHDRPGLGVELDDVKIERYRVP